MRNSRCSNAYSLSPKGREHNNHGNSERSEESIPSPKLGEADCELRANRLAEVHDCADPLNANNQARVPERQVRGSTMPQ